MPLSFRAAFYKGTPTKWYLRLYAWAIRKITRGPYSHCELVFPDDWCASASLLAALATKRGLTKDEMATKIMAKAVAFADISGTIIGHRQVLENTLAACATRQQLDAATATIESGWPV